jgi:hypothetical protein
VPNPLYEDISYSYNSQIQLGTSQAFTFTVNADRGNPLAYFYIIFETWPSGSYSCKVGFAASSNYPGGPVTFSAFLHDDQGNPMGDIELNNAAQSESNTKCSLLGAGTTAVLNGTTWTITANLVFLQPYGAPATVIILGLSDPKTGTGWLSCTGLAFPNVVPPTPSTVAIVSNNGMSLENDIQIFSVRLRDTSGGLGIWHAELVFFQGNSWVPGYAWFKNATNRCRVGAEVTADVLWVETLNGWNYVPFGDPTPQVGSNCTLYPQYSSIAQTNENTIEVRFAVSFPSTFSGVLQDHVFVADTLSQVHWDDTSFGDPMWNWFIWPSASGPAPTLPSYFTSCITVPHSGCTLYPYVDSSGYVVPYSIGQTYHIAPGVSITASGGASIQRDPNAAPAFRGASPMIQADAAASWGFTTSITGLTVLGNRWAIGHSNAPPVPNPDDPAHTDERVSLGQLTNQSVLAAGPDQVLASYEVPEDVTINTDTGYLSNNSFYDAPGVALELNTFGAHTYFPSVIVAGGGVFNSNQTGIQLYGPSSGNNGCMSQAQYFRSGTYVAGVPSNINIESVLVQNSSGGPIVVEAGYNIFVSGSTILDHQLEPPSASFESYGGAIVVMPCTDQVTISGNMIDGSNVGNPGAAGMELYSLNTSVTNNTLTNIAGDGMHLDEVCGASVYNNTIVHANAQQQGNSGNDLPSGGIFLANAGAYDRQTRDVLIWNTNVSSSAAGLYFWYHDPDLGFANVAAQYSCLQPPSSPNQALYGGNLPLGVSSPTSFCGTAPAPPAFQSCSAMQP